MKLKKEIIEKIRKNRLQTELAIESNISIQTLRNIINDKHIPYFKTAQKLAKAYGRLFGKECGIDDLFDY